MLLHLSSTHYKGGKNPTTFDANLKSTFDHRTIWVAFPFLKGSSNLVSMFSKPYQLLCSEPFDQMACCIAHCLLTWPNSTKKKNCLNALRRAIDKTKVQPSKNLEQRMCATNQPFKLCAVKNRIPINKRKLYYCLKSIFDK